MKPPYVACYGDKKPKRGFDARSTRECEAFWGGNFPGGMYAPYNWAMCQVRLLGDSESPVTDSEVDQDTGPFGYCRSTNPGRGQGALSSRWRARSEKGHLAYFICSFDFV